MSEHDPRDPHKDVPPQGPVPDPHRDEPAPLPDAHTRSAADADVIRPDQDEELGPVAELFKAAGAEAAAEVTRTEEAEAEALRQGAEAEGVEAAQIFSLMLATIVALTLAIVGVFFMVEYLAGEQVAQRAAEVNYPERRQIEARAADLLGNYAVTEEGAYRIPIAAAMDQVASAYYRQQQASVPAPRHFNTVAINASVAYESGVEAYGAAPDTAGAASGDTSATSAGAAGAGPDEAVRSEQTPDQPVQSPPTQEAPEER